MCARSKKKRKKKNIFRAAKGCPVAEKDGQNYKLMPSRNLFRDLIPSDGRPEDLVRFNPPVGEINPSGGRFDLDPVARIVSNFLNFVFRRARGRGEGEGGRGVNPGER